jgi:hypothetical protein
MFPKATLISLGQALNKAKQSPYGSLALGRNEILIFGSRFQKYR